MKRYLYILVILVSSLFLVECSDNDIVNQAFIDDTEVSVIIPFGASSVQNVDIKTRATYGLHYESMVRNLYVLLFANGERIYGRYFDSSTLNNTGADEYWTVNNMTSNTTTQTNGELHLKLPLVQNAELVLVANIDLDFMNLSEDRLGLIRKTDELQSMLVSLNQLFPVRNAGYFMMTSYNTGVAIDNSGKITIPGANKIFLERLDSKIEVNVKVDPNATDNNQKIESFTPESWQVVNIPKTSYLIEHNDELQLDASSYFNIDEQNFETTENETVNGVETGAVLHGFSFYTLENKRSGSIKKSVNGNIHDRERRNKFTDNPLDANYGTYDNSNGLWEYAPELATYIIVKGELSMVVDPGQTEEQHLIADVTYHIHLGDFSSNKDNYDLCRNTNYKYTINIKGVDKIETEVETSSDNLFGITEEQPGASGHLYEAEADIYTFDAHYGQRVYTIKAPDVDIENMTWYVRTPFGREGIPLKDIYGNEIYNDLDYKWVEFAINDKNPGSNTYSDANLAYPSDKNSLMYVIDMLRFVKEETIKWKNRENSAYDDNDELKFTVFVDEFYYDENPMNPNDHELLWKKFVNQPNRLMHILCKNQRSADGESSITGSVLTIRQRSIQTPYNISLSKTNLTEAWGCETEDETKNIGWFYSPDERVDSGNRYRITSYTPDNTSRTDGLYNTACLLNLVSGNATNGKSVNTNLRWDTFLDFSANDVQLKDEYKAGLYSVLLRNRDLDGDGIIDPEELRWYIASLDQLCGLFFGDQGLSTDAQLYPIELSLQPNTKVVGGVFDGVYPWRQHVVSSTAWNQTPGNVPTIVWAEEGASTGEYQVHYEKPAYSPVRCIRNLGLDAPSAESIITAGSNCPKDNLVQVTKLSNGNYRFDFTNINAESLRESFTTKEPVPGNEYSYESRLFYGFETGPFYGNFGATYQQNGNGLKVRLENGDSPSYDNVNYADYRVPNIREGVAMNLYCDASWWRGREFMVSNYYSFGYYGNRYDGSNFYSWAIHPDRVTVGTQSINKIQFVKDWDPR